MPIYYNSQFGTQRKTPEELEALRIQQAQQAEMARVKQVNEADVDSQFTGYHSLYGPQTRQESEQAARNELLGDPTKTWRDEREREMQHDLARNVGAKGKINFSGRQFGKPIASSFFSRTTPAEQHNMMARLPGLRAANARAREQEQALPESMDQAALERQIADLQLGAYSPGSIVPRSTHRTSVKRSPTTRRIMLAGQPQTAQEKDASLDLKVKLSKKRKLIKKDRIAKRKLHRLEEKVQKQNNPPGHFSGGGTMTLTRKLPNGTTVTRKFGASPENVLEHRRIVAGINAGKRASARADRKLDEETKAGKITSARADRALGEEIKAAKTTSDIDRAYKEGLITNTEKVHAIAAATEERKRKWGDPDASKLLLGQLDAANLWITQMYPGLLKKIEGLPKDQQEKALFDLDQEYQKQAAHLGRLTGASSGNTLAPQAVGPDAAKFVPKEAAKFVPKEVVSAKDRFRNWLKPAIEDRFKGTTLERLLRLFGQPVPPNLPLGMEQWPYGLSELGRR